MRGMASLTPVRTGVSEAINGQAAWSVLRRRLGAGRVRLARGLCCINVSSHRI
jgi:hypothetical protein